MGKREFTESDVLDNTSTYGEDPNNQPRQLHSNEQREKWLDRIAATDEENKHFRHYDTIGERNYYDQMELLKGRGRSKQRGRKKRSSPEIF